MFDRLFSVLRTSPSRIYLLYGDVPITGERLQNLDIDIKEYVGNGYGVLIWYWISRIIEIKQY